MSNDTVSWNILKHWIYKKEVYEQETGQSAPLTYQERQALNILVPGICPMTWRDSNGQSHLQQPENSKSDDHGASGPSQVHQGTTGSQEAPEPRGRDRARSRSPIGSPTRRKDAPVARPTTIAKVPDGKGRQVEMNVVLGADPDLTKFDWISTLNSTWSPSPLLPPTSLNLLSDCLLHRTSKSSTSRASFVSFMMFNAQLPIHPNHGEASPANVEIAYAQVHALEVRFIPFSVEFGRRIFKWGGICVLSESDLTFPSKEGGFVNGEMPCFTSKKASSIL